LKAEIVKLQRDGKLEQVAELQYGKLPELEQKLKSAAAAEAKDGKAWSH
jgi:ATP-dependent Clp protease ATP-binding subunit ClpB